MRLKRFPWGGPVSSFASAGEANTPPWSPIEDSPFTLSGSDSHTVDVGTHGAVMVEFIDRSGNATEQLAFQVAGKTSDYFYYDVTGSRVAPDSLVPLTSHTDIVGTQFTMWPIGDGYSAGGAVACPTGKLDTVAPAMRWTAYNTNGMPSTISFQNTENTDKLDFTIAVYSRP